MPEQLKTRLEQAAAESRRTTTAEIVHRLEQSLEMSDYIPSENAHPENPKTNEDMLQSPVSTKSVHEIAGIVLDQLIARGWRAPDDK